MYFNKRNRIALKRQGVRMIKHIIDILMWGNRNTPDNPTYVTMKMIRAIDDLINDAFIRGVFVGVVVGAILLIFLL